MVTRIWCIHLTGPDGGVELRVRDHALTLCAACWTAALAAQENRERAEGGSVVSEEGIAHASALARNTARRGAAHDRTASRANGSVITISPTMQWGQACVDGTRLTLSALLARVASEGREAAKADWDLTDDQIDVALWFAAAYQLRRRRGFAAALAACPVYRRAWGLDEEAQP